MQDDYPLPDDGEAEEARLREQERAELDAQASEDAELIGHAQDARDALEPHEADAEALGFALAWWDEEGENGVPVLDIATDMAGQACGRTKYLRDLQRHGYDPEAESTVAYVGLNAITGPLVVAGLQILGTIHPHVRDECKAVLKQIFDARPDGTEDEMKSMEEAAIELAKEQFGSLGVQVVGLDEFIEKAETEEQRRRDAGLN